MHESSSFFVVDQNVCWLSTWW